MALVVAAFVPPVKSSSATNGAAAGPPAEMSTPAAAANALGAARPATSAVSTRAMAARTAVAVLGDGPAHPPDPGGRRGEIRMFISPPMCQLCKGRRERGRLVGLSTRLI